MIFVVFTVCTAECFAQSVTASSAAKAIQIVELQGSVEILSAGAPAWAPAQTNQILHPFDRIHTAADSRIALRWSDQSILPFGASTELEILPPDSPDALAGLHLVRGIISFFHRDQPGRIRIITRGAVAGVEGTEFVLAVDDAERTTLSVVDGKVKFGNEQATLLLTNGEQASVELGEAPRRTAGFIANNLLQWCFYYPAVIDPEDLQLTTDEQKNLAGSLAAYRAGDLLAALDQYPAADSGSDTVKIYHAALLLAVGEVAKTEAVLAALPKNSERTDRLANSLRQLIAAVKRQAPATTSAPQLTSEMLANSYFEQSRALGDLSLQKALQLAQQATVVDPRFGFAWARVAELEFCFGRQPEALSALNQSLALSPRNAQALALKGFVLAAQNQPRAAIASFDAALAADAALGNAWLGRGLSRIRLGDLPGGREDLLVAAALEPQRAELRSYLGKAYQATGDDAHATKELTLAKKLDPNDPTAWLYSALLNQENSQINDAIRDLEKSQSLNDNRSVYRSQLLLDQDQAVRSANLASIYLDAGMTDVSVREAGRAVSCDYANYSAHNFLANSYEQLRSPSWDNLRYDAPAADEFWIANLLAPTGAGWLNVNPPERLHQQLFEQNRLGIESDTTYLSRGAWYEQGDQFYTSGDFSYDLGTTYHSDPGQFPGNDYELREVDVSLKGQLTAQDSIFGTIQFLDYTSGDTGQYYSPPTTASDFHFENKEDPNITLGYHHDWSPSSHTLFFATYRTASEPVTANGVTQFIGSYSQEFDGIAALTGVDEKVTISPNQHSTELQQIFESPAHTTILGARYEWGTMQYQDYAVDDTSIYEGFFPNPPVVADQSFTLNNYQLSLYGYHTWQVADALAVTAGLDYDWLYQPANPSTTPFTEQEKTTVLVSPKAGIVWTPADKTTVRAAFTRSLSGLGDSSGYRLEPTEVAGFNQAFRSLIPESVVADTSGSQFNVYDLALEQKFDTGTYAALSGQLMYSKLNDVQGNYVFYNQSTNSFSIYPVGFQQTLNYREESVMASVDQLLGKQWTAGANYEVSQARLDINYPGTASAAGNIDQSFQPYQSLTSTLQTVNLHANWNNSSGLFSLFEANWYHQSNSGFNPAEPGDDFWQFNAYAGYRFWQRRAEITFGLLNIFDQNYNLEPLNLYNDMDRSRTFLARLRFSF